jgi:predicted small secreted protein
MGFQPFTDRLGGDWCLARLAWEQVAAQDDAVAGSGVTVQQLGDVARFELFCAAPSGEVVECGECLPVNMRMLVATVRTVSDTPSLRSS